MTVRIVTCNTHGPSNRAKNRATVKRAALSADVLLLQEADADVYYALEHDLDPKVWAYTRPTGAASKNPIAYRKTKVAAFDKPGQRTTYQNKPKISDGPDRATTWLPLIELATGQPFIPLDAHQIHQAHTSHKERKPGWDSSMRVNADIGDDLSVKYPGVPQIWGGDWNPPTKMTLRGAREIASPATYGSKRYDRFFVRENGVKITTGRVEAFATQSDHKSLVGFFTFAGKSTVPPAPKPQPKPPAPKPQEPTVPTTPAKIAPPTPRYVGPAKWKGANNNKPIHRIVIHATAGAEPDSKNAAENTVAYSKRTTRASSYHYVADAGGSLQYVYDSTVAFGAPPNRHSIHYELCCSLSNGGAGHWGDADHVATMRHAAKDIARLCLAYDVPIRKVSAAQLRAGEKGICGHDDVRDAWRQTSHWDPSKHFPWAKFIGMVQEEANKLLGKTTPAKPSPQPPAKPEKPNRVQRARALSDQARAVQREAIGLLDDALEDDPTRVAVQRMRDGWQEGNHQIYSATKEGPAR